MPFHIIDIVIETFPSANGDFPIPQIKWAINLCDDSSAFWSDFCLHNSFKKLFDDKILFGCMENWTDSFFWYAIRLEEMKKNRIFISFLVSYFSLLIIDKNKFASYVGKWAN